MDDTPDLKQSATPAATLGAQVRSDFAAEFEVIRQQRGDRYLSDTIRAALEEFAKRHWAARVSGDEAA